MTIIYQNSLELPDFLRKWLLKLMLVDRFKKKREIMERDREQASPKVQPFDTRYYGGIIIIEYYYTYYGAEFIKAYWGFPRNITKILNQRFHRADSRIRLQ